MFYASRSELRLKRYVHRKNTAQSAKIWKKKKKQGKKRRAGLTMGSAHLRWRGMAWLADLGRLGCWASVGAGRGRWAVRAPGPAAGHPGAGSGRPSSLERARQRGWIC